MNIDVIYFNDVVNWYFVIMQEVIVKKAVSEYLKKMRKNSYIVFLSLARRGLLDFLPDKIYLKLIYRARIGKRLNLQAPKSYNEKLQWLKLYNRKPEYTSFVDKYAVREYIAKSIGKEYLFDLIGVWESVEEIDFNSLPQQFVLKCTHDSGGVVICKDKDHFDVEAAKSKLEVLMNTDYYLQHREWPYKNVVRRIIAEKYMVDESGSQLKDYKFFCFDGEPKALYVASDRYVDTRFDFYDMEFNHLDVVNGHSNSCKPISKPERFEEMIEISRKLSKGFPHVRIDLYNINGRVYFGEMTFFHMSGFSPFYPEEYDKLFGEWLLLPEKIG